MPETPISTMPNCTEFSPAHWEAALGLNVPILATQRRRFPLHVREAPGAHDICSLIVSFVPSWDTSTMTSGQPTCGRSLRYSWYGCGLSFVEPPCRRQHRLRGSLVEHTAVGTVLSHFPMDLLYRVKPCTRPIQATVGPQGYSKSESARTPLPQSRQPPEPRTCCPLTPPFPFP